MRRSILHSLLLLVAGALFSTSSLAGPVVHTPVSWSISGPGVTSAVQNSTYDWDLRYNLFPAGFSTVTWTVDSNLITTAGDYEFDWNYSGSHAFFQVRAFLRTSAGTTLVNVGPQNCCAPPSVAFNYSGNYTFTGVGVGDIIGFTMGGSNSDSNNFLRGTLNLQQVPEPSALAILGLGLAGIAWTRRRRKSA